MEIKTSATAARDLIDSLEFAIAQLETNYHSDTWLFEHSNAELVSPRRSSKIFR